MKKMKLQSIILAFLLIGLASNVQAQGIEFETGDWASVLAKAKKENKMIFVDAYTTWCGPCKWMAKNAFVDEAVGEQMNAQFIAYKLDMEKGEGIAFAKEHQVNVFPTLLYFSAAGDLIHKSVGAKDAQELLALNVEAADPSKQMATLRKKYEAGADSKEFLAIYIQSLVDAYEMEAVKEPLQKYWNVMTQEEKLHPEVLDLVYQVTGEFSDFSSDYTQFFLRNRTGYSESITAVQLNEYRRAALRNAMISIAAISDKAERIALQKQLESYYGTDKKEIKATIDYYIAQQTQTSKVIEKKKNKYLNHTQDWTVLNQEAWQVVEEEKGKKEAKKGLYWINRSVDLDANFFNLDTKANILYQLGDYVAAKQSATDALQWLVDNEMTYDTSYTEELLQKIEAKL